MNAGTPEDLALRVAQLEAQLQQLRDENQALRGAQSRAAVAQIDLDAHGRVLLASARAHELLRLDPTEHMAGYTLAQIFPEGQCVQLRECMQQLGSAPGEERRCMLRGAGHRGRAPIWLRAVLTRSGMQPDSYSLVLTDVTDIEMNRRELAADVDLLEALLQVAGVEFFEWHLGRRFRCSAGFRDLLGMRPGTALDGSLEDWAARIHPADRERMRERWQTATGGPLPAAEYRVIGDDDRVRWLRSAVIARHDEHGSLEHISGVAREVSVEHEARMLLAERAALVELIPDFLMRLAPDGRVTYMNAVAERFFLESALRRLPVHLNDIVYVQRNPELAQAQMHAVVSLGQQSRFSLHAESHPEQPVFDVLATPVLDGDGQIAGALIAARDVSRLARAEVESRTALRRLQTLLETAHASIVMANADGRVTLVNQAFCQTVGLLREQVLGSSMADYCFPEDADTRRETLRTLLVAGTVSFNWRMRKADGSPCWFRVDGSMVGAAPEGRREFVFIGTDIHLAEQERAAMIERERWLDRVLSDAGIGAFRFNRSTRSGELVGAYAALYQQATPHVVMPDELLAMILPDHRDRVHQDLAAFLAQDGRMALDFPVSLPDGQVRWIRAYLRVEGVYSDCKGTLSSVLLDITQDHERAHEREELQRQVYQAQKAESLGVMAGGIAHDLNNMLMAAIGQLNLALSAAPQQGPLGQYLSTVESVLGRMEGLTERMLAYAGKSASRMEHVDVAQLLDHMEPLLRASAGLHTRLRLEISARPLPIRGDATQVEQVILNFVQNAVDAMGERGGIVRLRADLQAAALVRSTQLQWPLDVSEHYVVITVRDDGPGIPEAALRRIFEPFFTTKTTGRGLGLSVVQGIVKAHGGSIKVLSEVDLGTEFRVYLPMFAELPPPTLVSAGPAISQLPAPDLPILAIDDDEDVLAVTTVMLEQCGYQVAAYLSGDEAIAELTAHPDRYGAAVVDLTMPVKDGVTVARELRGIVEGLPILFVSGYSKEQAAELVSTNDSTQFLRKPFRIDALNRALQELLRSI